MTLFRTAALAALCLGALAIEITPAAAQPWDGAQKWGVGFHATALGLAGSEQDGEADDQFALGGAGIQLRYRLNGRWELEAELDHVSGEREADGAERHVKSMLLGAMFHINPRSQWVWSVVGGMGGGRDDVEYRTFAGKQVMSNEASFAHAQLQLGVSLERRFRHIGVAAQLRAVAAGRSDDKLDGPAFEGMDEPTPRKESGGRFNIVATYYF